MKRSTPADRDLSILQNTWFARLHRRAKEHGVNIAPDLAAHSVALYACYLLDKPWPRFIDNPTNRDPHCFIGTDNLPDRVTVREYMTAQKTKLSYWFGHEEETEISTYHSYKNGSDRTEHYWVDSAVISIPNTCQGYEPDYVTVGNYRFFHAEYKDLFAYGLLEDKDSCVVIHLDKPYYDSYKLDNLMDDIHAVSEHGYANDQYMYEVETEFQEAAVKDELDSFIRGLDLHSDIDAAFFPKISNGRYEKIDWEKSPWSEAQWIAHIWSIIRDSEIEFGDGGTYINIDKVVQKSPFYQMGQKETHALDALDEKLESAGILSPAFSQLVTEVRGDLAAAMKGFSPAHLIPFV